MTSYVVDVMQCPGCTCRFTSWAVASCNGFGARVYTDGYVDGPMYDEGSALLACPRCRTYLWRCDVPVVASVSENEHFEDGKFQELPLAGDVRRQRYEAVLKEKVWRSEAQEQYIRTRAWWSFNRGYRGNIDRYQSPDELRAMVFKLAAEVGDEEGPSDEMVREALARNEAIREKFAETYLTLDMSPPRDLPPDQTANLERLVELLDPRTPDEAVLRAEALRELGHFERCLGELDRVGSDEDMERWVARIRELALQRQRRVALIA